MDLRAYLTVLRRNWTLLVAPVVIGLIVAVVALTVQTPKYLSTANVYVSVGNTANANDLSQANSFAQSAAANFAALAEQPYVLYAVRKQLGVSLSSDQIAKEMTTSVAQDTSIISIEVLDSSPTRAAALANATARQLSTAVSVLNPTSADGTQNVRVTVVRTASAAESPSVPNRPLGLALGLLGGLLLGVVLIILRELLDTRVRTAADLQALIGAPTVGQIPQTDSIEAQPLTILEDRGGAAAEGFRLLQLNLEYLRAPSGVKIIGIASAVPAEGKSTVAANLAIALATAGHRVALVDADLRRPRLHSVFGLDNGVGLTEVLIGRADVLDVVQPWGDDDYQLAVVPSGTIPPNPGELLQSARLQAALARLAEEADVVVVDGPPLLAVADSAVLARAVDAVLVVASMRRSHRGPVTRAVGVLQSVGAKVLGGVATMTKPTKADSEAYRTYSQPRAVVGAEPVARRSAFDSLAALAGRLRALRPAKAPAVPERPTAEPPTAHHGVQDPPAEPEVQALPAEPRAVDEPVASTQAPDDPTEVDRLEEPERADEEPVRRPPEEQPIAEESPGEPEPAVVVDDPARGGDSAEAPATPRKPPQPARKAAGRSRRPSTTTKVPSTSEVDQRTLRSMRRQVSAEDLRVLRSFPQRSESD